MKAKSIAIFLFSAAFAVSVQARHSSHHAEGFKTTVQATEKINLNQADVKTLIHSMSGIGEKRAEAIVKYRTEHGQFRSVLDLARVKGFGKLYVKRHLSKLKARFSL